MIPDATDAITLHTSARQAPYDPQPHNNRAELVVNTSK